MVDIELHPIIFPVLTSLLLLWCVRRWFNKPSNKNPPPSPPKLPIIGNLHQLSSLPHRSLHALAKKHGPVMLLRLGSIPVLIVSSADAAREIMKDHDVTFSNRPLYQKVINKITYNGKDIVFAPYGEYWRQLRSIFVLRLLSSRRVQFGSSIREEETAVFLNKIRECKGGVNLSKMFDEYTNDVICRSAFGRKYGDSDKGEKFIELLKELIEMSGSFSIGDYIPWLSWISCINGVDKRVEEVAKGIDGFFEDIVQERIDARKQLVGEEKGENFVDIMLDIQNENTADLPIDRVIIKAMILDVFGGGTDTISTTLEWTMTELLRHPRVMLKVQNEVRGVMKGKQDISVKDLENMHYLKAVIKETLRCHPALPLLLPRIARNNAKINECDVEVGTVVLINAWAIGRDPKCWDEAEEFKPERFFNSSIDFKGLDFEFIPFGGGRRGCPGTSFAVANLEYLLANILQKFEWKLADGKDVDMNERPGVTVHKDVPLLVVATPCQTDRSSHCFFVEY